MAHPSSVGSRRDRFHRACPGPDPLNPPLISLFNGGPAAAAHGQIRPLTDDFTGFTLSKTPGGDAGKAWNPAVVITVKSNERCRRRISAVPDSTVSFQGVIPVSCRGILRCRWPQGLTPGMMVEAEIKTGKRRVIEYVLSPLAKATREAGRER